MTIEKEKSRTVLNEIQKAVASIRNKRPAYEKILNFYEKVFLIQEASGSMVEVEPAEISESALSLKKEEKLPLVQMSDFIVDHKRAAADFIQICNILGEGSPKMAQAAPKIIDALDRKLFKPESFFDALLQKNDESLTIAADDLGLDPEVLSFVIYNSVQPSVNNCGHQFSVYLDPKTPFDAGYCPVCGNLPALSSLGKDGERFLSCSFCWHQWRVKRIFCPFCENTVSSKLNYLYADDEKEYRVDGCDKCKKYLKTIDTRKLERPFYPRLEEVATLHLDMIAQEKWQASDV
ncbi:formate dehydrogenase accessory protein FdhE [Desulfobacterales bacterium HSG16]|nr:formate dehydrogenase accessory protein FdhE [Desulfobacterales bacterium HSG16]